MAKLPELEHCYLAFGTKVKAIREFLGITQLDLSKRTGLSRTSIANIEAGRQRVLLHDIEVFAVALASKPQSLLKEIWAEGGENG